MKISVGISNFLEEISSLSHSIVFLYFFALIRSLRNTFLSLLPIFWNSAFRWVYHSFPPLSFTSILFSVISKASSDNHFGFLHLFFLGMVWSLPPVQCREPLSIVLQALCLSDLSGSEHIFRISLYSSLKSQQLSMYLLHSFGSKMLVIQWMKNKPDEWITFRLKLPFVRQSYILFKLLFIRAICYMKMRG